MARPYKLKEVEKSHGDLDELIPSLVNDLGGQKAAADYLGVSQWLISTWLKENNYKPVTKYVKEEALQCNN